MQPLNSPIETGTRVLVLLNAAFPDGFDLDRLALLDHALIHSADLGGPSSLHPQIPLREGELGVKKQNVELGLQVMLRAKLAEARFTSDGIQYFATEKAYSFVRLLESGYVQRLRARAEWVRDEMMQTDPRALREMISTSSNRSTGAESE